MISEETTIRTWHWDLPKAVPEALIIASDHSGGDRALSDKDGALSEEEKALSEEEKALSDKDRAA